MELRSGNTCSYRGFEPRAGGIFKLCLLNPPQLARLVASGPPRATKDISEFHRSPLIISARLVLREKYLREPLGL